MRIRRIALLVVSFVVAASAPLAAQVRADPGTVINGRVAVRVTVTLSDNCPTCSARSSESF